ncbi:MAG: flagellar export chaperone FliS [Treponema sp.]|nr:flagellar export chaperone FliS [Treponema sp.]
MAYKNALSAYRETKVTTAGQGQLIIMLYNEAVKHLDEALGILESESRETRLAGSIEKFGKAVIKTQELISELMVSLDFDQGGDIAANLFSLYSWFNRELVEANIDRDPRRIIGVRNHICELRTAWLAVVNSGAADTGNGDAVGVSIAG